MPKILIAGVVGLGVLTMIAALVLSWRTVFSTAPFKASVYLSDFGKTAVGVEPLDVALSFGDDLRLKTDHVSIERVWIDTCERSGPGRTPPNECDRQPFFERALVKAILQNGECAPELAKDETISFTIEVHYRLKKVHLFVGKSGSLSGKPAKAVVECVGRALPEPDWENLQHDHTRYVIGVLTAYPAEKRE